ncbi:SDR family NAD(P)-dependent oxidoreductase [Brachybacterium tyrofermentans]|uniref:SDR family NAD(P)-dependent oxidoreductase n=1 Tax=Brachybacterium tyrofermentans TaxID=47848 RepID=UPI003FD200C2
MTWNPARLPDLTGRVYAVTGATGGIGYFAAEQLASAGAEVVLASRSPEKIEVAARAIRGQVPRAVTSGVAVDLVSLASVREGAEQLSVLPRLDGIFLNGGPMHFSARETTEDGLPLMVGAHTVANVALVAGILSARAEDPGVPLRVRACLDRLRPAVPQGPLPAASGAPHRHRGLCRREDPHRGVRL